MQLSTIRSPAALGLQTWEMGGEEAWNKAVVWRAAAMGGLTPFVPPLRSLTSSKVELIRPHVLAHQPPLADSKPSQHPHSSSFESEFALHASLLTSLKAWQAGSLPASLEWHELVPENVRLGLDGKAGERQGLIWEVLRSEMEFVRNLEGGLNVSSSSFSLEAQRQGVLRLRLSFGGSGLLHSDSSSASKRPQYVSCLKSSLRPSCR